MQAFEEVIQDTYLETEKIFFKEESSNVVRVGSDRFLDLVIEFKEGFDKLTIKFQNLNESLEEGLTFCSDEYLQSKGGSLRSLLRSSKRLVATFVKSAYYPGVKTAVRRYEEEVNCLQEFIQDIELRTKVIKEDDEFQALIAQINSL
ncbi:hypothetical protein GCM10023188_25620 [Pontibacter saemangeumensis]|uniref:Uncharacterized protein n=1 Tax=Pontibacter saemangeumensis TaxID=1084525 RepID=A0ABP8LR09_9BACT